MVNCREEDDEEAERERWRGLWLWIPWRGDYAGLPVFRRFQHGKYGINTVNHVFVYHCPIGGPIVLFFLYIFQMWGTQGRFDWMRLQSEGWDWKNPWLQWSSLAAWELGWCLHSHICMHSIQLVKKDHPRLCRHPSWWDQPFPVGDSQYMHSV